MKISILMPCLNAAKTISSALSSVQENSDTNIEVIVADGGSSDDTRKRVAEFPDVQLLAGGDDGLYEGLNRALSASTGDYVLFLNADDTLPQNTLSKYRCAAAKTDNTVDLVSGDAVVHGLLEARISPREALNPANALFGVPAINARLFKRHTLSAFNFDGSIGMSADRLLLFNLACQNLRTAKVEGPTYRYLAHQTSKSLSVGRQTRREVIDAEMALARYLLNNKAAFPENDNLIEAYVFWQSMRRLSCADPKSIRYAGSALKSSQAAIRALSLWRTHRGLMSGW